MRECLNCGSMVTGQFARVFGDNDDDVYGCPNCCGIKELYNGAGAMDVPSADPLRP